MQVTAEAVGVPVPWKPNSTEPLAGTLPFHGAGANVVVDPDVVTWELHAFATVPDGSVIATLQPDSGTALAVTRTLATKPPGHWLATV